MRCLNRTNVELKPRWRIEFLVRLLGLESNQCGIETFDMARDASFRDWLESNQCGIETQQREETQRQEERLESNQCGIETQSPCKTVHC